MPDTKSAAWSAEDVAALTRLWPSALRSEIQAAFPLRKWKSLSRRAERLRLKRRHQPREQVRRWSPQEAETLERTWGLSRAEIEAALPTRSWESIADRAKHLKLGHHPRAAKPWSAAEDAILRRSYATAPWPKMLAALPTRQRAGVKSHAEKLGLTRSRRPNALAAGRPDSVWRIVPGRLIHVSDHGEVRSTRTGRLLPVERRANRPIPHCRYRMNGRTFWPSVPQLMLEAFRPNEAPSGFAGLRDGDMANLTVENCYWTGRGKASMAKPSRAKAPDRADVLRVVLAAVPHYHEPHVRDDIVQDVVAAVLAGEATLEALPLAIRKATTRHHAAAGTYKTVSLDAEVFDGSKQNYVDRLANDVARY